MKIKFTDHINITTLWLLITKLLEGNTDGLIIVVYHLTKQSLNTLTKLFARGQETY